MSRAALATALIVAVLLAATQTSPAGPANPMATASVKRCGHFRIPGLRTKIRVRVKRGPVGCTEARRVMRKLFHRGPYSNPEGWHCIGPQTGYARCTKPRPRRIIVAHF
jgi:hypothetical protein